MECYQSAISGSDDRERLIERTRAVLVWFEIKVTVETIWIVNTGG